VRSIFLDGAQNGRIVSLESPAYSLLIMKKGIARGWGERATCSFHDSEKVFFS
jgi:hypothetical protein